MRSVDISLIRGLFSLKIAVASLRDRVLVGIVLCGYPGCPCSSRRFKGTLVTRITSMDRNLRHSVTASSVHCLGIGCVLALCYLLLHDFRNLSSPGGLPLRWVIAAFCP